MIDCPICHVKNHDDARFCAECGQRLNSPGQAASPNSSSPPPPQVNAPEPPKQPSQRLHSPLLGDVTHSESAVNMESGEAQRLRQMSSRNKDDKMSQEPQYKNPYDPRNAQNADQTGSTQQPQQEHPRHKLRSPLLAGEEFDDEPLSDEPEAPTTGKGLRSPLLGGGGGGGVPNYYGGLERRAPVPMNFSGSERRRPLHSPLLHNTESMEAFNAQDYEDDEPVDENNPNVLRSPLLAARRPVGEKPAPKPAAPVNPPIQPMQFGVENTPASEAALNNVFGKPQTSQPTAAAPVQPTPAPSAPMPPSGMPVDSAPSSVPPAFQNMNAPGSASRQAPPHSVPSDDTAHGAHFAPQSSARTQPQQSSAPDTPRRSRLLPAADEAEHSYAPQADYGSAPSPLPKIIGIFAVLLLLAKAWVVVTVLGTPDWGKVTFIVVDQMVGAALIVCLIVLAFSQKK